MDDKRLLPTVRTADEKRRAWLQARQTLVGASEVAALFNVDVYGRTIADIYDEKVGAVVDGPMTPDMERGYYLEPIILELLMQATGMKVTPMGLQIHCDEPHMGATPDGEVREHEDQPTAEVKSVRQSKFTRIKHRGLSDGWQLQVQAQLEVCDRPWGIFAFQGADPWQMITFNIERDREVGFALREKVNEFWRLYVSQGIRPTVPLVHNLPEMPVVGGEMVIRNDPAWAEAVQGIIDAKDLMKTAKEIEAAATDRIKELMGGYGAAEGSQVRCYFKQQKGHTTFDRKALAAAKPLDRLAVGAFVNALREVRGFKSKAAVRVIDRLLQELGNGTLDIRLEAFEKHGDPFETFRSYVLKPEVNEGDDKLVSGLPRLRLESGSDA